MALPDTTIEKSKGQIQKPQTIQEIMKEINEPSNFSVSKNFLRKFKLRQKSNEGNCCVKVQAVRLNPSNRFRKKNQMLLKTFDNPNAFEIPIKESPLVTSNA